MSIVNATVNTTVQSGIGYVSPVSPVIIFPMPVSSVLTIGNHSDSGKGIVRCGARVNIAESRAKEAANGCTARSFMIAIVWYVSSSSCILINSRKCCTTGRSRRIVHLSDGDGDRTAYGVDCRCASAVVAEVAEHNSNTFRRVRIIGWGIRQTVKGSRNLCKRAFDYYITRVIPGNSSTGRNMNSATGITERYLNLALINSSSFI